jgi:hypothetical protein
MMRSFSIIAAVSLSALAAGCASPESPPTAGTRMADQAGLATARAENQVALSDQWKAGEKMTAEGQKMIRRSQEQAASRSRDAARYQERADKAAQQSQEAQAALAEGQRMIAGGERLKAQAVAQFPPTPAA